MGTKELTGICLAVAWFLVAATLGVAAASNANPIRASIPERTSVELVEPQSLSEMRSHIHQLGMTATEKWPEDYAWIWPADGGFKQGIVIGFSRDAEEHVEELAKTFPWPDLLKAETVKYSTPELQELQDKMIAGRKHALSGQGPLAEQTEGRFDLGGDLKNGKVIVYMPEIDSETKQAFFAAYGTDVRFVESGLGEFGACTNRQRCGKALRAGIQARNQPANVKKCSTGFTVKVNGVTRILSAAHCSQANWGGGNEKRYHGFTDPMQFGVVVGRFLGGGVDAEALSVQSPFVAHPWIYRDDDNQQWPVKYMMPNSATFWGDTVCRAGNTTGRSCGTITDKMFSFTRQGVNLVQLVRTNACSGGGDSGGPVFFGYEAWGIHAGYVTPNSNPGCGAGFNTTHSFYSPINWVLTQLGATLELVP